MRPVFSVTSSIVEVRVIVSPTRSGWWNSNWLPAHMRRGSGTGGRNPPRLRARRGRCPIADTAAGSRASARAAAAAYLARADAPRASRASPKARRTASRSRRRFASRPCRSSFAGRTLPPRRRLQSARATSAACSARLRRSSPSSRRSASVIILPAATRSLPSLSLTGPVNGWNLPAPMSAAVLLTRSCDVRRHRLD